MTLTRKVLVSQTVPTEIADLVYFVRRLERQGILTFTKPIPDGDLVEAAFAFHEAQHGED